MARAKIKAGVSKPNNKYLGDFLETLDWDFFATLTTQQEMTLKGARRFINKYHEKILQSDPNTLLFWAAEKHAVKRGFHLHALIHCGYKSTNAFSFLRCTFNAVSNNKRKYVQNFINSLSVDCHNTKLGNSSSRIHLLKYQKKKGASHYLAKYITKQVTDYDFCLPPNKTDLNIQNGGVGLNSKIYYNTNKFINKIIIY